MIVMVTHNQSYRNSYCLYHGSFITITILMWTQTSDREVLREIGRRLRRERLNRNLTQAALAERTGLGVSTVAKAERGGVTTLATLVALLRGLDLLSRLDALVPETPPSPLRLAELQGRVRQRATGRRGESGGQED